MALDNCFRREHEFIITLAYFSTFRVYHVVLSVLLEILSAFGAGGVGGVMHCLYAREKRTTKGILERDISMMHYDFPSQSFIPRQSSARRARFRSLCRGGFGKDLNYRLPKFRLLFYTSSCIPNYAKKNWPSIQTCQNPPHNGSSFIPTPSSVEPHNGSEFGA